jgi:hypothetical protein
MDAIMEGGVASSKEIREAIEGRATQRLEMVGDPVALTPPTLVIKFGTVNVQMEKPAAEQVPNGDSDIKPDPNKSE